MSEAAEPARRAIGAWQAGSAAIIGLLLAYLSVVASRLALDNFDAIEVLLNAKSIANGGRFSYSTLRALLLPSLLAPYFALERVLEIDQLAWIAAHLTAVATFALLIGAFYALLRLDLDPAWAAVGSLSLALNPLLIHNAPAVKEDIPGALFTMLAFFFYLRGVRQRKARDWVWSGLFLGAAALIRFNLAPLLLAVIGLHELLSGRTRFRRGERLPAKLLALLVLPAALVCLLPMIVYPLLGRATWWSAPAVFLHEIVTLTGVVNLYEFESSAENFRFLAKSLTPPLTICAILGLVVAWRKPSPSARFHVIWLAVFLGFHTWVVRHKEARYLFALLPPVYFFAMHGLAWLVGTIDRRLLGSRAPAWLAGALVSLVLAMPALAALRACARFGDPVYTEGLGRRVSLVAAEGAGAHRIFWLGEWYPVHPEDYWFDEDDEFSALYHFGAPGVELFTGRPVELAQPAGPLARDAGVPIALRKPARFADGDVLIVNREADGYVTRTLPAELLPLEVVRLRILEMNLAARDGATSRFAGPSGETLELVQRGGEASLEGQGLPDARYLVYAESGPRARKLLGAVESRDGRLHGSLSTESLRPKPGVERILLYRFEPIAELSSPRRAAARSRSRVGTPNRRGRRARSTA